MAESSSTGPVRHGCARANGIRMHYVTAGQGEPLLWIHGTPKTHFYWYKLIPLLTEHFAVVAPDLRGFGYTDRPPAEEGYDSPTNSKDLAELISFLGHESFHVHGEDRGAEFAYVLAATQRDRVKTLSFCEMLLSGEGLEEWADGVYLQARMEPEAECILVIIGATPEGKKQLLGFHIGVRESAQSWRELLVDLKARGLAVPLNWPSETGLWASGGARGELSRHPPPAVLVPQDCERDQPLPESHAAERVFRSAGCPSR